MRFVASWAAVLVGALACGPIAASVPNPSGSISIASVGNHFELTVPIGHARMLLPRGNFEVQQTQGGGAAGSPRYFFLQDKTSGAILTGWFESARGARDPGEVLRQSWPAEAAGLTKAGMTPRNIENKTIGGWQAITYGVSSASEVSSHVRPLSDTSTDAEVLKLLQSLSFVTR